jgi:N-acetylmuramoyl-L-alanine amidase
MRPIDLIDVHHTAGPTTATVADITREHQRRGFRTIGYHWLVHELPGGVWTVSPGRPEEEVGAHDEGENARSIGVAIAGDYTKGPVHPDAWAVLVATVAGRCRAYPGARVRGHREDEPRETPTACPGFDPAVLRAAVEEQLRRAA